MKKNQKPSASRGALDLVDMMNACRAAGFGVEMRSWHTDTPPWYVSMNIVLREEGKGFGRNDELVGSFSIEVSGNGAGDRSRTYVQGVAVPLAIKLWGADFRRFEQVGHDINRPEKTSAWMQRALDERARQDALNKDFDRACQERTARAGE
jgi:hypothetical protein